MCLAIGEFYRNIDTHTDITDIRTTISVKELYCFNPDHILG